MKRLWSMVTSSGARDTYVLTFGNLSDSFIAFLFTIISFRLLTASDFGLFSAFNNLIFSACMILDLGLSQALLYYLPHYKDHSKNIAIGSAITLRLLISSIFSLVLIILAPYLSILFFPSSSVQMVIVSAIAIVMASFIDVLIYSLQGLRRFFISIVVSNTYSVSRLIAVLFIAKFALSYKAIDALFITVYGPIFGIILALYLLKPQNPTFNTAKKLLSFGGFMGLYRICQIIVLRSDVQIILTTLGANIAGTYSVAARMGNFYPLIIVTLNSLFSSRLRLFKNGISSKFLKKSLLLTLGIDAVMLICAWQAPLIIRLLFGLKALPAGIVYRYLTLAYLPLMTATLPIAILVFHRANTRFMGFLGIVQVSTMLMISFLSITRYGQFAPILGLTVANSLVLVSVCFKVIKIWKLA